MRRYDDFRSHYKRRDQYFQRHFFKDRLKGIFEGVLYRSRKGMILGVCRGIAEYFGLSVFWVRFTTLLVFFITGFWPTAVLYFIAAFLLKPEPVIPIDNIDEQEFYHSYVHSKQMAVDRIKRRYENLERRIQRMEHTVTSPEYNWEKKFRS